jgi:hypothetical protein
MLFEALMELRNEAVEAGDYKVACILFVLCGAMAEGEESLMELSVRCVEYAKERLKMESELMTDKNALQLPLLEVQEKITKIRKLSLDDLPSNQWYPGRSSYYRICGGYSPQGATGVHKGCQSQGWEPICGAGT